MSTCAGKLRKTILAFYAQTSDHVKRLSSPVANGKFSSISADTDTPWGRPEALRSVVTDLKVRSAPELTSQPCTAAARKPQTRGQRALLTDTFAVQERFHLKHVFCWHSLYGYWAGIDPASPEMQQYGPSLVWPQPSGGTLLSQFTPSPSH